MLDCYFTSFPSIEWSFKGVNQSFWKHFTKNHTSTCLFVFGNWKSWLLEGNLFHLFGTVVGEYSCIFSIFLGRISIEKGVKWITMPMNIHNKCNRICFVEWRKELFQKIYLTVEIFSRLSPYSVEIVAWKISAIITIVNSIHVDHWDYIKLIALFPALKVSLQKPLDHTFSYVRTLRFSRVLPSHKDDAWDAMLSPLK